MSYKTSPINVDIEKLISMFIMHTAVDSLTARLVVELERMFALYPEGFARHFEPRIDQANLVGSSWSEILNVSRHKFDKSFAKIGVYHKSTERSLDSNQQIKFQDCFYGRVWDVKDHGRTYYYRNTRLIHEQLLERIEFLPSTVITRKDSVMEVCHD